MKLNKAVAKLAEHRRSAALAKEGVAAIEEEIAQSEIGKQLTMARKIATAIGDIAGKTEKAVCELALASAPPGEKHPHSAITIKSRATIASDLSEWLED